MLFWRFITPCNLSSFNNLYLMNNVSYMYIFSTFLILPLISSRNKTCNQIYNISNICCTAFPRKTSGGNKLPHASDGVTGSSTSDGGLMMEHGGCYTLIREELTCEGRLGSRPIGVGCRTFTAGLWSWEELSCGG